MRIFTLPALTLTATLFIGVMFLNRKVEGQLRLRACRNKTADVNLITFTVSSEVKIVPGEIFTIGGIYIDIQWTINNAQNIPLDGFAVHFLDVESKRDHSNVYHSIEPLSCTSGEDHLYVTTINATVCDVNALADECSSPGSCLCPQPECALFYPPPCRSILSLLGPDSGYFVTIPPDSTNLTYPVQFGKDYEFSITPYYREFANLSPDITAIPKLDLCDDIIKETLGEFIRDQCVRLNWTAVDGISEYFVEIRLTADNTTVLTESSTTLSTDICGLDPCVEYIVVLLADVNGQRVIVGEFLTWVFLVPSISIVSSTVEIPTTTSVSPSNSTFSSIVKITTTTSVTPSICFRIDCGLNAACIEDGDGQSHQCVCRNGYISTEVGCVAIVECLSNSTCHQEATCGNLEGSSVCTCTRGFVGNGTFCEDIDECSSLSHDCDENAACTNVRGGFECRCHSGYFGNGSYCSDIDECSNNSIYHTCDKNADCTNVRGGFNCACHSGYFGNGSYCSARNCDSQIVSDYVFPMVLPGQTSYSEEKCEDSKFSIASIRCIQESTSRFFDSETFIFVNCSATIKSVTSRPFNTSEEVSVSLELIKILSSDFELLDEEDVQEITKYFENLSNSRLQYSFSDINNVAEITSHISEYYGQDIMTESTDGTSQKQSIVQSVTLISRRLDGTSTNFSALSNTVNIKVQDVSSNALNTPITFTAEFFSDDRTDDIIIPIEIKIPAEAFQTANNLLGRGSAIGRRASSIRVVSVGYRNSSLFPSQKQVDWIIASSLGDKVTSLDGISLSEPVIITNKVIKERPEKRERNDFKSDLTNLECVFWDFKKGSWSGEGCCLVPENPPKCRCNHLTNFAILVSKDEIPSNIAITVVTYVGCGLSIICLVSTLLVFGYERRLRRKQPMKVIMNICACLSISLFLFLFGASPTESRIGCSIFAAFLHYFLLATWFWMAIYSHIIYRDVVKVWETRGTRYNVIGASIFSYGIPMVIVFLNAGITLGYIDKNQPTFSCDGNDPFIDSSYNAQHFCWLQNYSLYFGFLLPVGILLIFNVVVFCIVIPKITCCRKEVQSSASPHTIKQHVAISVVMAATTGLSWIIGYLMLISDNASYLAAMSWVFAITNSLQGVFIFVFTVVRTGELQKCFRRQLHSEKYKTSTTSSTGMTHLPSSPRRT